MCSTMATTDMLSLTHNASPFTIGGNLDAGNLSSIVLTVILLHIHLEINKNFEKVKTIAYKHRVM